MLSTRQSTKKFQRLWIVGVLAALALIVAACGAATDAPEAVPTEAPPTAASLPEDVPNTEADVLPSVTVADQEIMGGSVTISEVVSDGPGWLVIHAQADGRPGPILGYSAVSDGENRDVTVQIDAANATETLYAMLHIDAGEIGTWEFPNGPDAPAQVDGQVVTPAFAITGGLAAPITPSVAAADQEIVGGSVVISEVVSDGPGWLVIHAQADGKPGPILGYSAVSDGENRDVTVQIDAANATETLYAMLHIDAGEIGTWEFPNGPDAPAQVDGQVVTPAFAITGGLAAEQPAPSVIPSVTVVDQALVGNTVTIAQVVSDGPGWLVIHARSDGKPGAVVGYSSVNAGTNSDVKVELDMSATTTTLYAMLHTDAGTVGTWEFPNGPDAPVQAGGQVVSPSFSLQVVSGEGEVEIEDFQFRPKTLVVRVGTTVKFANKDQVQHTATSDTGVWDSGYLSKGDKFFFTFTEPGIFPYYCIPHGAPGGVGMSGTIIVLP